MHEPEVRLLQSQLSALLRRQRRQSPPPEGLARSSMSVLGAVARRAEGAGPGQIAEELAMTSSNVAAALRELEAGGLIARHKDDLDSRRVRVVLTRAGESLVATRRHGRDSWLEAAVNELLDDDEQATLVAAGHLLERLSEFEWSSETPAQRHG